MKFVKGFLGRKYRSSAMAAAALVLIGTPVIVGYERNPPLPDERVEAVVEKFYEQISQARLRGGTLLLREAYKLVDSKRSRVSEARFVDVVQKYPPGFTVTVVKAEVVEQHADVTIEYRVASMFGEGFKVRNVIALNVDEATNTWKVDFTGETDSQDLDAVKASAK